MGKIQGFYYHVKGRVIDMFTINENELNKIMNVISTKCCKGCLSYICSEAECDIHKICEFLQNHLEHDPDLINIDEDLPF